MELKQFLGQPLNIALTQIRATHQLPIHVKETSFGNKNEAKGEPIIIRIKKVDETIEVLVSYF